MVQNGTLLIELLLMGGILSMPAHVVQPNQLLYIKHNFQSNKPDNALATLPFKSYWIIQYGHNFCLWTVCFSWVCVVVVCSYHYNMDQYNTIDPT